MAPVSSQNSFKRIYLIHCLCSRGGVLEDKIWSSWPWPQSLQVLGSRTALFFNLLKMGQGHDHIYFSLWSSPETQRKLYENLSFFFWRTPKVLRKFALFSGKDLFPFFFWGGGAEENASIFEKICDVFARRPFFAKHLRVVSLVHEHSCPWPREGLASDSPWRWPRAFCPRLHLWCYNCFIADNLLMP